MGPFRPNSNGGVDLNPWSWHNAGANMLYVEQPAGVGFSYSNTSSDYTVGDARAAQDVLQFMLGFTKAFPQFSTQPLFISGESYGGHYGELRQCSGHLLFPCHARAMPCHGISRRHACFTSLRHYHSMLCCVACHTAVPSISRAIVEALLANPSLGLNFQGFLVGNAWTWSELDNTGAVQQWVSHGMIANDTANGILTTCNMSSVGPLFRDQLNANAIASAAGDAHQLREVAAGGLEVTSVGNALGFKPKHPVLMAGANGAGASWAFPTYKAQDCNSWSNQATTEMGNTDIYYVTGDVCVTGNKAPAPASAADVRRSLLKGGARKQKQAQAQAHGKKSQKHAAASAAVVDAAGAVGAWPDSNNAAGCAATYDPCNGMLCCACRCG